MYYTLGKVKRGRWPVTIILSHKKGDCMKTYLCIGNGRGYRGAVSALLCLCLAAFLGGCAPKAGKVETSSSTAEAAEQAARDNQLEKAVELYEKAMKENPESGMICYHLGYTYGLMGNKDKEMELYQKAVDLGYEDGTLYYNLGMAYGERGDLDKAEQIFKKALDKDKNNADAHFGLGIVYESAKRTADAEQAYKDAIGADQKYLDAYYRLSLVYVQDQQPDKARETLQKLLQVQPDYPEAKELLEKLNTDNAKAGTEK